MCVYLTNYFLLERATHEEGVPDITISASDEMPFITVCKFITTLGLPGQFAVEQFAASG
jgi:hypothetical protein